MRSMTRRTKTGAILNRNKPSTSRLSRNNMVSSSGPSSVNSNSTQINRSGTSSNSSMLGKSSMFNRNTPSNMDKINTPDNNARTSRGRARTVKDSGTTNKPETHRNSTASSRAHGNSIAHGAGSLSTETGASAAATTATAFPTIIFVDDSARNTHSISTGCLSWCIEDTRDFSMADIGSLRLTHGRNTGGVTGTTTMTFT
jgi:hypothetical protein